ncbi:MAG: endonuclease [Gammaproteobacteria bacterium]|nr:endonuclease [Gammaproteobacteria bacterium]
MIFDWAVSIVAFIAITWTLLPMFRHDAWWIRAFEFPRVQVTMLSLIVLATYMAVAGWRDAEDKLLIAVLCVCIGFQLTRIAKYTRLYPRQLKSATASNKEDRLSLLVANVLTPNRNAEALLRLIKERDPDIVLAVETDNWWQSQLDMIESGYPFAVKHPLDNLYGMHLYSRLELIDPEVLFLVEDDVPSIHADVVLRSGHKVELHCLHPAPPSPTENPTSAERDAELLLVAKSLDARARPTIVMGDMNDVAWSASTRLFQNISGLLDPRIGRGTYSTFHARYPFMRWPLDHVFCSNNFTLVSLDRLGDIGSDHFPILAVLQHRPGVQGVHKEPDADAANQKLAREKIDKVPADEDALR